MVVGLGIDVVELDRIALCLERYGERFLRRVLTDLERSALPRHPTAYVAARFAAKEAAAKALGTGFRRGVNFHTIEVRILPSGKPDLHLSGGALDVLAELGGNACQVSLTHGRDVAAAVVVIEARP
ncbi:MAG: holo-[acyl-carrier-protein] synthase [Thermodesulfobacteriota bacterium]